MERLLRKVPGLSEHERFLFARSLSATPDERWAMQPSPSPLARLVDALTEEGIRFPFAGMTAILGK